MLRCCIDKLSGEPLPVMTDEEFDAWEGKVPAPLTYEPPQKFAKEAPCGCSLLRGSPCWGDAVRDCCYCPLRVPCICCAPCMRVCCCAGFGMRNVSLYEPDEWFKAMLSRSHPRCPEEMKGIWWMEDNVAAEGVMTMQDADWDSDRSMRKSAKNNWTVDAFSSWGLILTFNFWVRGGNHHFKISPSGKWINITVTAGDSHFIYRLQPGDVIKRPDGSVIEGTPEDTMVRASYMTKSGSDPMFYQYLVRRVAHLDADGNLVKTRYYDELVEAARRSGRICRGSVPHHVESCQVLRLAPELPQPTAAATAPGAPPKQQEMAV